MKLRNRRTLEPPFLIKLQHYFNGQLISAGYNESVDMDNLGMEKPKKSSQQGTLDFGY